MSGTSADGVDAAAVRVTGRGREMSAELLQHTHIPYDPQLQQRIFRLRGDGHGSFAEYAAVCRELTLVHADAAKTCLASAKLQATDIAAIAVHGQTFFHEPPSTIQLFDPALLAWETGCQVISDFRRADLAAGGQGAPLVPFADWLLFRHETMNRVLLNLGGIANLTYLPAGCALEDVIAFDCGPANCLSDHIMRTRGNAPFDEGGELAEAGSGHFPTAFTFARHREVSHPESGSLDIPKVINAFSWAKDTVGNELCLEDELATAATGAGQALMMNWGYRMRRTDPSHIDELLVSGGGTKNPSLLREMAAQFPNAQCRRTDLPPDAKEAVAFALLGAATLDGEPSNVPSATGASRAVVLGAITPKP